MATISTLAATTDNLEELKLYRKVAWRIMPLAIICYFFSYFDRINISFAKTQMQAELGLSDAAYGIAASMFFVGYVLFEVPSSIGLKRYGAPGWICRIMVSWGLATAALMFAYDQYTLYFLRFLVGVMEAGFGPAILFYLACWFPKKKMATINGLFFLSIPFSGAFGAPLAGLILEGMNGFGGLAGWHWLFLLSGLPCVALGFITLWKLDRDIESARWLSDDEKRYLRAEVDADRPKNPKHTSMWKVLLTREVAVLAVVYFIVKLAAYGLNFWMPNLIAKSGFDDLLTVGFLTALPYAFAFVGMILVTRYSDRTDNRRTPLWMCMLIASVGYFLACLFPENSIVLMSALVLACMGSFIAIPIFWAIPQTTFSGLAIASGIAAINSVGQLSGIVAPAMVGFINDYTGNSYMGMLAIAPICLICVVLVVLYVPKKIG
jgi:MFS family permease